MPDSKLYKKDKSAKEMFEELDYEFFKEDKDILVYRHNYTLGGYKEIIFHKRNDGLIIDYSIKDEFPTFLSYKEAKAINKQIDEIGGINR